MLRSFHISAAIFDFQLTADETLHHDMFDWVWGYFEQRYRHHHIHRGNTSNSSRSSPSNSRNMRNTNSSQPLISSYFGSNISSTSSPALSCDLNSGGINDENGTEDAMLQKALELSKRHNDKGKAEMDDSDSGSSFSDEEQYNKMTVDDDMENEEEKKEDGNEENFPLWNKGVNGTHKMNMNSKKGMDSNHSMEMNHNNNMGQRGQRKKRIGYRDKGNDFRKRFIPPLYFQHHGHSRTIIGIMHNKKSGLRHLLVLDPSVKKGGGNLLNNVRNGNISSLLRSKKQIVARKYQLVAIPAFGMMSERDRNACKTIQSMDVTLVNRLSGSSQNQ